MDAAYFRDLAQRCYRLANSEFELTAVENFRRLGDEFSAKVKEIEDVSRAVWTNSKEHEPER
jgi:hypothetical protein